MHFCVWRCIPDVSMERDTPRPPTLPPFYSPVFVFFVKNPEVELLDHTVVLFLISWETSIMFSLVVVPTYIPTKSAQEFPFLHILSNTCYFCLFEYSNSDRHKVLSQLCFNFHVPDSNVDVCVCVFMLSNVGIFVKPKSIAPSLLSPWNFPGKNEWDSMVSDDIYVSVGHLSLFLLWKNVHLAHLGIFN